MAGKFTLELKVGIFVFIGLVILTLAVFSISEVYIFRPGYTVDVRFDFASGIDIGAPVRVAGIQAGEVKSIEMAYDDKECRTCVVISVWIEEGVRIPQDSLAFVSMMGLIGETYLEIIPGQDYTQLLADGDILIGRDPASTDTVMEIVRNVASNFNEVLDSVNDLLDDKMRADFKDTVKNAKSFTGNLDDTLDEELSAGLKETVENFREFSSSLKVITGRLERGEGKLGKYLKPSYADLKKREEESQAEEQEEPTEPAVNW